MASEYARGVCTVQHLPCVFRPEDHVDVQTARFEARVKDVVIHTIGGETVDRSFEVLTPGGGLVSSGARPDQDKAARYRVQSVFFLVTITTEGLCTIANLIDADQLATRDGTGLPLAEAPRPRDVGWKAPQAGEDRLGRSSLSSTSKKSPGPLGYAATHSCG
jgi:hypothetical protein